MHFAKPYSSDTTTCKSITIKNYFQNGNHIFVHQEIQTLLLQYLLENTSHLNSHPPTTLVPMGHHSF